MMRPSRASVATRLLAVVLPRRDVDAIIGDLEEECASRSPSRSGSARWYWAQVMRSMPALLWLPIHRRGWRSTFGVAIAACGIQAAIEVTTGAAVHELSPPDARWPAALALVVTLTSLTLLSYQATKIRPGAAIALASVAALALVVQLLLAAQSGRGLPWKTLAALVVVPAVVITGGVLSRKTYRE
jgi:hypothetical protein